jgi:integrase-like protein
MARRLSQDELVFPGRKGTADRSGINEIMTTALRRAGLGPVMVPHGWRATFSTIMNEVDPASFRVIDVMLAHSAFRSSVEDRDAAKGSVEGHYNHATFEGARHRIACLWADMLLDGAPTPSALVGLEGTHAGSNVVPLRKAA